MRESRLRQITLDKVLHHGLRRKRRRSFSFLRRILRAPAESADNERQSDEGQRYDHAPAARKAIFKSHPIRQPPAPVSFSVRHIAIPPVMRLKLIGDRFPPVALRALLYKCRIGVRSRACVAWYVTAPGARPFALIPRLNQPAPCKYHRCRVCLPSKRHSTATCFGPSCRWS